MEKKFFNKSFCLEVSGDYACFTRPEMKVERVSYDVITPSAARAIFEAIFWKPAIDWKIKKIEVMNPIKWISVRRNEVGVVAGKGTKQILIEDNRQQRAGLFLKNVRYRLHAELVFIPPTERVKVQRPLPDALCDPEEPQNKDENPGKYNAMFARRASKGQCFNQPYFGCREFSCAFKLIENPEEAAQLEPPLKESRDLGFMLFDMDFSVPNAPEPVFFRAAMKDGVIELPDFKSEELRK